MFRALVDRLGAAMPAQCAVCRAWPAQPVCEACVAQFAQPVPRCETCALPLSAGTSRCGECALSPAPLDRCVAALDYAYPWSSCMTRFKFHGHPGWAGTFATLMKSTPWAEPALEDADVVLPMPLSLERLRERGFNQSLELARRLAPGKLRENVLLRFRHTAAQSALDRKARLANVKGAFALEPSLAGSVRGRHVVLANQPAGAHRCTAGTGAESARRGRPVRRPGVVCGGWEIAVRRGRGSRDDPWTFPAGGDRCRAGFRSQSAYGGAGGVRGGGAGRRNRALGT